MVKPCRPVQMLHEEHWDLGFVFVEAISKFTPEYSYPFCIARHQTCAPKHPRQF